MLSKKLCALLALVAYGIAGSLGQHDEHTWVEPNAWSRDAPGWRLGAIQGDDDHSSCPVCAAPPAISEEGVALAYYKKFVANLFSRTKLQYNEIAALYQRTLLFTILPAQLEQLEQLNDPRDIDGVLTEIIATARTTNASGDVVDGRMGIIALVLDIIKDLAELLRISEVRFALIVLATMLLGWLLHHRYHFGIVRMVVFGFLLFGYFMTYLECNRKLEIEEVIAYIDQDDTQEHKPRWFAPLANLFGKNYKNERIEKLKKSNEIKLQFCRPDHVLIMYGNELFLKQLEFLIEKFTATISTFSTNLSFPYNIFAPCMLLALIAYVLKLTYKYILSPKAWASLLPRSNTQPHQQQHAQLTSGVAALNEDRISGENLKMLLNAIKGGPNILVKNGNAVPPAVSGVEEVLERIEAAPAPNSAHSSKSNSPDVSLSGKNELQPGNNNEVQRKEYFDMSKVTLEDCRDVPDEL